MEDKAHAKAKKIKRGVVYMSRVPPNMTPLVLRNLLGQYGEITRTYLVPEDEYQRKRRSAKGKGSKQSYVEGWIEFTSKNVAKRIVKALNARIIGGKKRSCHHDDLWNLKYLKGFKWEHLTEKIAYERRIRDQKLRMEISRSKRENSAFLEKAEQSKLVTKIEERKRTQNQEIRRVVHRQFYQKAPVAEATNEEQSDEARHRLKFLFTK